MYFPEDIVKNYILPYMGDKYDQEIEANKLEFQKVIRTIDTSDQDFKIINRNKCNTNICMYLPICLKCGNYDDEYGVVYHSNITCKCSYTERLEVYDTTHYCEMCEREILGDQCYTCIRNYMSKYHNISKMYFW